MNGFLWAFAGFMIGGIFMTVMMSCLQISRINDYEDEIRELRSQLKNK